MTLPQGADYSLTESALIPFQAEPTQPDHEGSPGWRIPTAHQEGSGIQALGQAAAEAETVSPTKSVGFRSKSPQSPGKRA